MFEAKFTYRINVHNKTKHSNSISDLVDRICAVLYANKIERTPSTVGFFADAASRIGVVDSDGESISGVFLIERTFAAMVDTITRWIEYLVKKDRLDDDVLKTCLDYTIEIDEIDTGFTLSVGSRAFDRHNPSLTFTNELTNRYYTKKPVVENT